MGSPPEAVGGLTLSVRLADPVLLFLDELEAGKRSAGTIRGYATTLRQVSQRAPIFSVDPLVIRDYLDSFRSTNTRAYKLTVLRQFYRWARGRGLTQTDPSAGIPTPKEKPRAYVPITEAEFQRVRDALPDHVRLAVWTMYRLGSRVTETCRIKPEQVTCLPEGVVVDFPTRKGDRPGYAAFYDPPLQEALCGLLGGAKAWLFPDPRSPGYPLTYRQVHQALQRAGRRVGVRGNLTPHRLRHTFATEKAEEGWNLLVLMQQLGHTDPRSTRGYYKPSRKGLLAVYRRGVADNT